jgi:hypothetical protein
LQMASTNAAVIGSGRTRMQADSIRCTGGPGRRSWRRELMSSLGGEVADAGGGTGDQDDGHGNSPLMRG